MSVIDEDHIEKLCRDLKTYSTEPFRTSSQVIKEIVVAFDTDRFMALLSPESDEYDPTVSHFSMLSQSLFIINETWKDRQLIRHVCDCIAKLEGWEIRCEKRKILCNRNGNLRIRSLDGESRWHLKKGCTWNMSLKPLVRSSHIGESTTEVGSNKRTNQKKYKDDWTEPVMIVSLSPKHSNGCQPCRANRIEVVKSSGNYVRKIPNKIMYQLSSYVDDGQRLSHQVIKCIIAPIWPKYKPITGRDTSYIRIKVMKERKRFRNDHCEYDAFKDDLNSCELLNGIDDRCNLNDDEAYELARELCEEVVNTCKDSTDTIFSFQEYLALIAERAKGFSYEVVSSSLSGKKKNWEFFG